MDIELDDVRPATRVAIAAVRRGLDIARGGVGADEITSRAEALAAFAESCSSN